MVREEPLSKACLVSQNTSSRIFIPSILALPLKTHTTSIAESGRGVYAPRLPTSRSHYPHIRERYYRPHHTVVESSHINSTGIISTILRVSSRGLMRHLYIVFIQYPPLCYSGGEPSVCRGLLCRRHLLAHQREYCQNHHNRGTQHEQSTGVVGCSHMHGI